MPPGMWYGDGLREAPQGGPGMTEPEPDAPREIADDDKLSAFVMIIPLVFMLSPGSRGLRQFETWLTGESITGVNDLKTTGATLLAIAMGMLVGSVIGGRWVWFKDRKEF